LDPDHRGPLDLCEGSCLGTSQEKVREFGRGDHEVARRRNPDNWRILWGIVECEWNTGGTKDSRVAKCRGAEIHVDAELRSAEEPRFAWTCGGA
jgi:hypothetical protein